MTSSPQSGPACHVFLRPVDAADLPLFFELQLDPDANYLAAFTHPNPADRAAFDAHWTRILNSNAVVTRTIVADGRVAGHIARFELFGDPNVSYWIDKPLWGRGIATRALAAFLSEVPARPLYGRVAQDNHGSRRVLEKCGFVVCGSDRGFAEGRGVEVDELILRLAN